jgi:hypothetical protein
VHALDVAEAPAGLGTGLFGRVAALEELALGAGEVVLELGAHVGLDLGLGRRFGSAAEEAQGREPAHASPSTGRSTPAIALDMRSHSRSRAASSRRPERESE